MSEFRKLVERILKENGINLKEWDTAEELKYQAANPEDHTGENSIDWTLSLPLTDQIRQVALDTNLVGPEDLENESNYEFNVKIDYDVISEDGDEQVIPSKIYMVTYDDQMQPVYVDVTNSLAPEYLMTVGDELENSGKIELHSEDPRKQWTSDYHDSLL